MSNNSIRIEDIVITPQLLNRGFRNRNTELEKEAFQEIARQMSFGTLAVLNAVCKAALSLCDADSSGVSLLRVVDSEEGFTWDAMGGKMASYIGGHAPRHHSPCGYCLDQNSPQLYAHPERYFEWMRQVDLPIVEGMVIPLYDGNQRAVGTIWVISHRNDHQFDQQDLRVMTIFASHASAALRMQELY